MSSRSRSIAMAWLRQRTGKAAARIKASRLYPADVSWTRAPAWAFQIPLAELIVDPDGRVHLLCEKVGGTADFHRLDVPHRYFLQKRSGLHIVARNKGRAVSLYLGADDDDMFRDQRGPGRVPFGQFLVRET